jgi:hypothetical protein
MEDPTSIFPADVAQYGTNRRCMISYKEMGMARGLVVVKHREKFLIPRAWATFNRLKSTEVSVDRRGPLDLDPMVAGSSSTSRQHNSLSLSSLFMTRRRRTVNDDERRQHRGVHWKFHWFQSIVHKEILIPYPFCVTKLARHNHGFKNRKNQPSPISFEIFKKWNFLK